MRGMPHLAVGGKDVGSLSEDKNDRPPDRDDRQRLICGIEHQGPGHPERATSDPGALNGPSTDEVIDGLGNGGGPKFRIPRTGLHAQGYARSVTADA